MSRMSLAPILRQTLQKTSSIILSLIIGLSGLAAAAPLMSGSAFALSGSNLYVASTGTDAGDCQAQASPCQTIAYAISQASSSGDTINLESNVSITSAVNINKGVTLDGNGFTLSPVFAKTNTSNNASIMVLTSDVTIQNLTINGSGGTSLHGINVYEASNVNLNNVRILNNGHAALIVNGSTVTATDLNTSGNAWGAVDVDPGSGVTAPSVFTLNSGSLSESNQIWSDGSHVSGSATVTVNASGYNMYKVGGTSAWYFWTNQPLQNYATITTNGVTTAYTTVQAAVTAASAGDTINVAPGTYNETVNVSQKLTILGAQAGVAGATASDVQRGGSESYVKEFNISHSDVDINGFSLTNAGTQVYASGTSTLSGLVVENNIFSGYSSVGLSTYNAGNVKVQGDYFGNPAANSEAMQIRAGASSAHGCNGSQVLNNIFDAATNNGGADVNFSCTGSDSSGVTVSGNTSSDTSGGSSFTAFSGVDGNITISDNTAATDGSPVFFFGNVSGSATITGNTFSSSLGSVIAIYGGEYTSDTPNTGSFTISNNPLLAGVHSIKITSNGLASGGSLTVSGNNLTGDSSTAIVNNSAVAVDAGGNWWGNALGPDSSFYSGDVNVSSWCSVSGCSATQTASSGSTSLPSGPISTPTVNGSTSSVTIPPTNSVVATTSTADGTVQVKIPAGTTVTADSSVWDGTISAPTVTSVSLGSGKSVSLAIEVGAGNTSLTFDKAVRLVLPGQAGKSVGFVRSGTFTAITDVCSADSQTAGDALPADGDCYVNVGSDLVIWTKHFTTFVAYSPAASPTTSGTSSSSSAGTANSGSNSSNTAQSDTGSSEVLGASSAPTATTSTSSATTTQPSSAEAFQPPSGGNNKFLGVAWYIWLIGIAGVALASYIAYAYLSVDRK